MSEDEIKAELEKVRQENAALKQGSVRGTSMKVSEKGGLSVYGRPLPGHAVKEQWTRLLAVTGEIQEFIRAHDSELKTKGD